MRTYIGKRDKNGDELFVGAIVKSSSSAYPQHVRLNADLSCYGLSFKTGATCNIPDDCEIIGCIETTPELLVK